MKDNLTIWSFTLAETPGGGTLLTQRREAPEGISDVSRMVTDKALGGVLAFQEELRAGMRRTLAGIRAEA